LEGAPPPLFGDDVARPRPFLLCRYRLSIDHEPLSSRAQLQALQELQGKYFAASAAAERQGRRDSAIFRARSLTVDGEEAIAWSVGRKVGTRITVQPGDDGSTLEMMKISDPGVHYSDFVAVPRLGVLAVDDRSGDPHLGGKPAVNRFQVIFGHLPSGMAVISLTTTNEDVQRALRQWKLTEFSFVVRPANPHPPGDLSRALSEELRKDGIGRQRGSFRSLPGQRMQPSEDGPIAAVRELADEGYGQYAMKGVTPEGHNAQIKAPEFDDSKVKNQQRQAEPRQMRVVIEVDVGADDAALRLMVTALRSFYER
jgi:hypothetical protein